jgi:hypothetical protein
MKHIKKILALALVALSLTALALPALAATYTIQKPAGASGAATVRGSASSSGQHRGTIGSGSTVDITNTAVTNDYVKVKVLSVQNGTFVMGRYPNNEGYVLATWVNGFAGGGTNPGTVTPPSGTPIDGYCNASSVYVRTTPHSVPNDNKSGVTLSLNQSVKYVNTLVDSNGSDGLTWFYITSPRTGYVASQYITKSTTPPAPTTSPASNVLVDGHIVGNHTTVAVYHTTSAGSGIKGNLLLNSAVKYKDVPGGFVYIEAGTLNGYVASSCVNPGTPPAAPSGYRSLNSGSAFSTDSYPRASEVDYEFTILSNGQGGNFYVKVIGQMSDYSGTTWKRQVETTKWVTVPAGGAVTDSIRQSIRGYYGNDIITEVRLEVWNFSNVQGSSVKIRYPTFY